MHVAVATVVHHPSDARILHRQIRALTEAGHQVTYVAPWEATETEPPEDVRAVDVPRAVGRRRFGAVRAARRQLRKTATNADVILLHDPELLFAVTFWRDRPPVVWDVHEDPAASLTDRAWVPGVLRPVLRFVVRVVERLAERRFSLLLAEESYTERFRGEHPVVANDTWVPVEPPERPGDTRVVYLGRISRSRGADELLALASRLPEPVRLELIGQAESNVEDELRRAHDRGELAWLGRVPNDEALARIDGALAGLSLLRDEPNFRGSRPTKIVEYMARGVPVITTPSPVAAEIVREHGCGVVVPFEDVGAVVEAVERLRTRPSDRAEMGARGYAAALEKFDWARTAPRFVEILEDAANSQ